MKKETKNRTTEHKVYLFNGKKVVIIRTDNDEDASDISYYRTYYYLPLSTVVECMETGKELKDHFLIPEDIRGTKDPFVPCEDEAPFRFEEVVTTKITRAKPVVKTMFAFDK